MREYNVCQICVEEGLGVPLVEKNGFMVCPICQSSFPIKKIAMSLSQIQHSLKDL